MAEGRSNMETAYKVLWQPGCDAGVSIDTACWTAKLWPYVVTRNRCRPKGCPRAVGGCNSSGRSGCLSSRGRHGVHRVLLSRNGLGSKSWSVRRYLLLGVYVLVNMVSDAKGLIDVVHRYVHIGGRGAPKRGDVEQLTKRVKVR